MDRRGRGRCMVEISVVKYWENREGYLFLLLTIGVVERRGRGSFRQR
jgi:hypothetical protein